MMATPEHPTAFISGHLDLTLSEFKECYYREIYHAIMLGHNFVVGDAAGCDTFAQEVLAKFCRPDGPGDNLVTVYHMMYQPRNLMANFSTFKGFRSDKERDEMMTLNSTYDIAWVRPGRENSGTARNIKRRELKNEWNIQQQGTIQKG
jgi:hypothetical protein